MVGERGANSRIQYFSMDGTPRHVVKDGVRWPSIFEFRGDVLLMPDLKAVVTLFDANNKPLVQLGDARMPDGKTYEGIRDKDRSVFQPGKFVAPHGACFDKAGNIFVAEWVEVGRVSKLRKVS
jgi:sugar lactone lactonase YvrE